MNLVKLTGNSRRLPIERELDSIVNNFFDGFGLVTPIRGIDGGLAHGFTPRVNVKESQKEITVSAELPGLDEKDIKVELHDDILTISGEKKYEKEEKDGDWHHIESSYGTFQRSVSLGAKVDGGKTKAEFKKGILSISLPKVIDEQEKKRTIEIKAS